MAERYPEFTELLTEGLSQQRWLLADQKDRGEWVSSIEEQVATRRRWRDAVAAQAALAQVDDAAAKRLITSMLNQMLRLARLAEWWESHSAAVIAETVEYAAGNHEVASSAAQRAWDAYWSAHSSLGQLLNPYPALFPHERVNELSGRMEKAEQAWLTAWDQWHSRRIMQSLYGIRSVIQNPLEAAASQIFRSRGGADPGLFRRRRSSTDGPGGRSTLSRLYRGHMRIRQIAPAGRRFSCAQGQQE